MGMNGFFDHIDLGGLNPSDRAAQYGYSCTRDLGDFIQERVSERERARAIT